MTNDLAEVTPGERGAIDTAGGNGRTFRARKVRSVSLVILAALGIIFLLRYAQTVFVPIVLAILVSYALDPFVTAVARLKVPRVLAAAIVLLGLLAGIGFGLYSLRYQADAVLQSLPVAAQQIQQRFRDLRKTPQESTGTLDRLKHAAKEIEKTASEASGGSKAAPAGITKVQIEEPVFRADAYLWYGSIGLLGLLSQAVMVGFLVFFLLGSGDLFKRKLVRVIGTKLSEKRITLDAINEINGQIERFLLIQIFTGVLVGACTTAALWAFGLSQPAIWGVAAGILNSIPYFGAIIVSAGLALVAFLQFGSLATAAQIAGVAFLITSLEGFLLTPCLMGRTARINGVAMFLSLLFWSWLWGAVGLIVAVPLMMVIKIACERVDGLNGLGELLGERD